MPGPSFSPDFYEKHWAAVNRKYDIQQELAHAQAQEALAHGQLYGQQATVLTPAQAFNLRASGQLDVERAATEKADRYLSPELRGMIHDYRGAAGQVPPPATSPAAGALAVGAPAAGAPATPPPFATLPSQTQQDRQMLATEPPPPASSTPPPPAMNQQQSSFEQKTAKPAVDTGPLPTFSGRGGGGLEDLFSSEPLARRGDYLKYKAAGDADVQPLRKGSANVSKGGKAAKSAKSAKSAKGGKNGSKGGGGGEPGGLEQMLPALLAAARGPDGPDAEAAGPQAGDAMAPPMAPGAGAPPGFAEGTSNVVRSAIGALADFYHKGLSAIPAAQHAMNQVPGSPAVQRLLQSQAANDAFSTANTFISTPRMPGLAEGTPDVQGYAQGTGDVGDAGSEHPHATVARALAAELPHLRGMPGVRAGMPGARRYAGGITRVPGYAEGDDDVSGRAAGGGVSTSATPAAPSVPSMLATPSLTTPNTGGTWTPHSGGGDTTFSRFIQSPEAQSTASTSIEDRRGQSGIAPPTWGESIGQIGSNIAANTANIWRAATGGRAAPGSLAEQAGYNSVPQRSLDSTMNNILWHVPLGNTRPLGLRKGITSFRAPNVQPQPNYPFGAGYLFGATVVPGQGTGRVDKVPAMLAPHEAVLNKAAADKLGRAKIAKLNAQGVRAMQMNRGASR